MSYTDSPEYERAAKRVVRTSIFKDAARGLFYALLAALCLTLLYEKWIEGLCI